jgi:hypothetical protein
MNITKPNRVARTFIQHLIAKPSAVFPLLCPVREADWIDGWDPISVLTYSGAAEPDCIFTTAANPVDDMWYITRHEQGNGFVEMLKITPAVTVCKITIQLYAADNGSDAVITYSYTSLGPEGDVFLESFTEEYYQKFMQTWESRINYYLVHGRVLHIPGT